MADIKIAMGCFELSSYPVDGDPHEYGLELCREIHNLRGRILDVKKAEKIWDAQYESDIEALQRSKKFIEGERDREKKRADELVAVAEEALQHLGEMLTYTQHPKLSEEYQKKKQSAIDFIRSSAVTPGYALKQRDAQAFHHAADMTEEYCKQAEFTDPKWLQLRDYFRSEATALEN